MYLLIVLMFILRCSCLLGLPISVLRSLNVNVSCFVILLRFSLIIYQNRDGRQQLLVPKICVLKLNSAFADVAKPLPEAQLAQLCSQHQCPGYDSMYKMDIVAAFARRFKLAMDLASLIARFKNHSAMHISDSESDPEPEVDGICNVEQFQELHGRYRRLRSWF